MLKNRKLRAKFTVIMLIVYIFSLPVMLLGSSYILRRNAIREILKESNLMLAAMEGARKYTSEVLRPTLAKELPDRFVVEAMSATFVARGIEMRIREKLPSYSFKEATLNPLNLELKADPFEKNKIEEFRSGALKGEWRGYKQTPAGSFYVIMRPVTVREGCLKCHGDPSSAPPEQLERYGRDHGYGWKDGEIQTVNAVYVPADVPIRNANKALLLFSVIFSAFFLVVMGVIDILIRSVIIRPVEQFVEVADDISRGRFDRDFSVVRRSRFLSAFRGISQSSPADLAGNEGVIASRDEIGRMALSFNKMISSQRTVVSGIRDISTEVSSAAEELAASSEQVSSSATEVNRTIRNVADDSVAGMQHTSEIQRMIESFTLLLGQAREQANQTLQIANQSFEAADHGRRDVVVMNDAMDQIKIGSEKNLEEIQKLDNVTRQIEGITGAISGIAEQINLLALNAAIEAARAGEVGRGFAVVADEIGKLAEQSTRQAKDVASMVEQIIRITRSSVDITRTQSELILQGASAANAVNDSLGRIVDASKSISNQAQTIHGIAEKEVQESEAVRSRIESLSNLMHETANRSGEVRTSTDETARAMEEVARGSQVLSSLALRLQEMVEQFKI